MKLGKEVANLYFCNLKMALSLESLMKVSKEYPTGYVANRLSLTENAGQTKSITEGNVWKFRAFLIAFPRMILRVSFVTYFMYVMLILTLST